MKVIPISAYLNEFNVEPVFQLPVSEVVASPVELIADPVPVTLEDELEKRFREGVSEGEKQAKIEFAQELKEQEAFLLKQHNQAVVKVHEQFAEQIADQLTDGIRNLESNLSNTLAEIVRPFVSELLKNKIVSELQETIVEILRDSANCQLTVKGPSSMLARLKTCLAETDLAVKFLETNDMEISVDISNAKIETRFQLWSKLVEKEIG